MRRSRWAGAAPRQTVRGCCQFAPTGPGKAACSVMVKSKPGARRKTAAKNRGRAKKKSARAAAAKAGARKSSGKARRKPSSAKEPAATLRLDLDVFNESTGVVFTSLALCGNVKSEADWM